MPAVVRGVHGALVRAGIRPFLDRDQDRRGVLRVREMGVDQSAEGEGEAVDEVARQGEAVDEVARQGEAVDVHLLPTGPRCHRGLLSWYRESYRE